MSKIIFGLLSLILTFFDVRVGLLVIKEIYGERVYSLAISNEFLIFYFLLVFIVEYAVISTVGVKVLRFLRH